MVDRKIYVHINLNGTDHFVGTLWSYFIRGKESSDFEYSRSWLKNPQAFSLEPSLYFDAGKQIPLRNTEIFGSFGDSAPDTWGRILMRRYEIQLAKQENRLPKKLNEIDYLLYVSDETRQGALRFKIEENGEFQYPSKLKEIPSLVKLNDILLASERVSLSQEKDSDLKLLLAPGSSLGGARPKASVIDQNGDLCIAKFPKKDDFTNSVLWEALALILAEKCGLNV